MKQHTGTRMLTVKSEFDENLIHINKPFRIPDIQKGIQKVVEASS